MKSLIQYKPQFNPALGTLDFRTLGTFNINRLYGVINVTRNAILYAPGATGYGVTSIDRGIVKLEVSTAGHSASDVINVYYETDLAQDVTAQELQFQILAELKVMNQILAQGLNINSRDVDSLREEYTKTNIS
jgi:hypothetical protein